MTFDVREITAADTYHLRRAVLRGGDPSAMVDWPEDGGDGAFHLGVVDEAGDIVAIGSFSHQPVDARPAGDAWRLRGMAVAESRQGAGLGRVLLRAAYARLVELGADVLWCNARMTAADFYAKAGFIVVSDIFTDDVTGLAHQQMLLDLPAPLFTDA